MQSDYPSYVLCRLAIHCECEKSPLARPKDKGIPVAALPLFLIWQLSHDDKSRLLLDVGGSDVSWCFRGVEGLQSNHKACSAVLGSVQVAAVHLCNGHLLIQSIPLLTYALQ